MANLLTTLFASNEMYLSRHVSNLNRTQAFPVKKYVSTREFLAGSRDTSLLVSGGTDEERSVLLFGMIRNNPGCTIILHNGNPYMAIENFRKYGIPADAWDGNLYRGLSKPQMLSMLIGDGKDADLAFFFAYAFDVCESLGKQITIENMYGIDWLGIGWQQELLMVRDQRDRAIDLLNRFDRGMAEKAVKGICRLEQLMRSRGTCGRGINEVFADGSVLVKEVFGSRSVITGQCLEMIRAKAESGQRFLLVLDDVYYPESPVIRDNFRNVRLILSGDDLTQYEEGMRLTNRSCGIVAFHHANYGSAKMISEKWFGEYDRLYNDSTRGYSSAFLQTGTYNSSTTVRQGRDTRLKPEMIASIPVGVAFIRLKNGLEGYIDIGEGA